MFWFESDQLHTDALVSVDKLKLSNGPYDRTRDRHHTRLHIVHATPQLHRLYRKCHEDSTARNWNHSPG